tara:strand:- start:5197 stop:5319 length:123 start_codon:yes stop_codon:yes gene_type:complete
MAKFKYDHAEADPITIEGNIENIPAKSEARHILKPKTDLD